MLQFHTYKNSIEPWGFKAYVLSIRKYYNLGKYLELERLVSKNNKKYSNVCRYHLINSRLVSWGVLNSEFSTSAKEYAIANYSVIDSFSKQEFLACFGNELVSVSGDFLAFDQALNPSSLEFENIHNFELNKNSKFVIFRPRFSGLFSIIENIIAALYCANSVGDVMMLSPESEWWPYEIKFHSIFGNRLGLAYCDEVKISDSVDFDVMRNHALFLSNQNIPIYSRFKSMKYREVSIDIENWINNNSEDKNFQIGIPTYFVRAGDKLRLETVLPPAGMIEDDLKAVILHYGALGILSDDYSYAEDLTERLGGQGVFNLTNLKVSGHNLRDNTSINDVFNILVNFLYLMKSPVNLSCPSSNLVNAANWSSLRAPNLLKFKCCPINKYLLF